MTTSKSNTPEFYLFASLSKQPEAVFFKLKGETLAKLLRGLFTKQYAATEECPIFNYKAAASFTIEDRVLFGESLDWLDVYSDPDPGIYDPSPPKEMHLLAQYAVRAAKWEEMFRAIVEGFEAQYSRDDKDVSGSDFKQAAEGLHMPPQEWRSAGLILLTQLAQTYYKLLECTISAAEWFTAMDLELNQSYFWAVVNITNLLKNHEALKDFPIEFKPVLPDLYPSTITDLEWADMVAPEAEHFLSTVQQYVYSKAPNEPPEGSAAWIFIQLFRPSIDTAIERAERYHKMIDNHRKRIFPSLPAKAGDDHTKHSPAQSARKRFRVALSFPGERRYFVNEVAERIATAIGRDSLLYDKYHEPELARVDLDTYLQKLYHDESELIAVFLCSEYEQKEWCGLEWRSLRDLIKRRNGSAIMPLRFDDTAIPGLFSIDGYVEIGNRTPTAIAECILARMRITTAAGVK
jgi:hypothetical protein